MAPTDTRSPLPGPLTPARTPGPAAPARTQEQTPARIPSVLTVVVHTTDVTVQPSEIFVSGMVSSLVHFQYC